MLMVMNSRKTKEPSGTHVWLVLMKAYRALERVAARSIESLDVGLSDFGVLEILLHKGPLPVNDIGRRIHLTSGAITTAVDRLESSGLVTRGAHPTDRRARVVHLTARGKEHAARIFTVHKTAMDSVAMVLTERERSTLLELLKKLGISAEQHEEVKALEN
jgi:MarR family 2-MHQ and catechol resistance regulon transcriptional repressor